VQTAKEKRLTAQATNGCHRYVTNLTEIIVN
jgi:hypothetical protein